MIYAYVNLIVIKDLYIISLFKTMSIFNINPDISAKELESHITNYTQTDESIHLHALLAHPKITSIS